MPHSQKRSSTGHVLLPASSSRGEEVLIPHVPPHDVVSWTFGRGTVFWTIWPAVLLHTAFAAVVTTVSLTTRYYLAVPPVLITVLGVVIGFVIAYRASSGYDRYWTGRCCWSDLMKTSRTMSRLIWIHVPLRVRKESEYYYDDDDEDPKFKNDARHVLREKRLALDLLEGFIVALKHHLRGESGIYYEDLYHLVQPLHDHPRFKHRAKVHHKTHAQIQSQSQTKTTVSSVHPTLLHDPEIPAINEYGTFRDNSDCASSHSDSDSAPINPLLLPSSTSRRKRSRVLTELVPFSSFFSAIGALFRFKSKLKYDLPHVLADDSTGSRSAQRASRHGTKYRPDVVGGGVNLPLEILRCLSEWVNVLDERGVVPGNALGGLYSSLASFEDSLSALERILTTPLPLCVWLYLFLLPFQLVTQFNWFTIPGVGIAAFFYIGFLAAGEEIEQPFGYDENDLDLDLFCRETVHADIDALKRTQCMNAPGPDGGSYSQTYQSGIERIADAENK
ncbi:Bestrophin, RFP-TM, chloride channel-domain-containing protein [Phellopilus nigrolimitatus]|nr:Bestrophin, RFP-TM, chloride channel-domain-containing protein [Phellopilus nigrolimitatus]